MEKTSSYLVQGAGSPGTTGPDGRQLDLELSAASLLGPPGEEAAISRVGMTLVQAVLEPS